MHRNDCPGLIRVCTGVLSDLYGLTFGLSESKDDANQRDELPIEKVPFNISRLFEDFPRKSFRQLTVDGTRYSTVNTSNPDSHICFHATENDGGDWVAGRIEYIIEEQGRFKFVVRRNQDLGQCTFDPFRSYWDMGFEAKLFSSSFVNRPEVITLSQVVSHAATWKICDEKVVVLRRSKVSLLSAFLMSTLADRFGT
jgi:hypothetical protein